MATAADNRADLTRKAWLDVLAKYHRDPDGPARPDMWSPSLDAASRDEIVAIQNDKLARLTPFLYENSGFYRRRFDRLGLAPTDIRTVDDLAKWPVVDKGEMTVDAEEHPPFGTYTTMSDALWRRRGWMMFSTSGTTGTPRVFRYSQVDREYWQWSNGRALTAMDFRPDDTVFMMTGYGPHVWAWGVQYALAKLGVAVIPGGGIDGRLRAGMIDRFKPTILLCTPSYALYLGRVLQDLGIDPAATAVRQLFLAGEPANSIPSTRARIQDLWGARIVEFYGCTEAAPQAGGYSCAQSQAGAQPFAHLMEDVQIWETVDPDSKQPSRPGERGLTVCTNVISESSPQLRFLVGDFTTLDTGPCACGRTHVRAMGCFGGRADDLINMRGVKFFPAQVEQAVRSVDGLGDEFQVVLASRAADGMDVMTVVVEHPGHTAPEAIRQAVQAAVRTECEIRCDVDVVAPGILPKTEFKAKRIRDDRHKT